MHVFGVTIDNKKRAEIDDIIDGFLDTRCRMSRPHQIATLNPEILLHAKNDAVFAEIVHRCDLRIADGVGLHLAAWRCGEVLQHRYAGVDVMHDLLVKSDARQGTIFIAASTDGLSSYAKTAAAIATRFPHLHIDGADIDKEMSAATYAHTRALLEQKKYDVIVCNFGAPWQEIFLSRLKDDKLVQASILIGVGGAYDYITQSMTRAPVWMRTCGLEWLFRLMCEPRYRIKRICAALIYFPLALFVNKPHTRA